MLYFSYGSNMSTRRIRERTPLAQAVTVARLSKHRLKFHKKGKDGTAKCDAEHTDNARDVVYGVVFRISNSEKQVLDRKEGLRNGYEEKNVSVIALSGETFEVFTYYATHIDASLLPLNWYKEHVLRGAREHDFPSEYIATIETAPSMPDPDSERRETELSIYH
jgi:gamma-glutamylcyclotransferase